MAVQTPSILILGKVKPGQLSVYDTFNSGSSPYNGTFYTFLAEMEIVPQAATSPSTSSNPDVYDANSIQVGFKFALPVGKVYDVVSIVTSGSASASVGLRDTDLKVFTNSTNADNIPTEGDYGAFFPVVSGSVELANLQSQASNFGTVSYWTTDLLGASVTNLAISGSGGGSG